MSASLSSALEGARPGSAASSFDTEATEEKQEGTEKTKFAGTKLFRISGFVAITYDVFENEFSHVGSSAGSRKPLKLSGLDTAKLLKLRNEDRENRSDSERFFGLALARGVSEATSANPILQARTGVQRVEFSPKWNKHFASSGLVEENISAKAVIGFFGRVDFGWSREPDVHRMRRWQRSRDRD